MIETRYFLLKTSARIYARNMRRDGWQTELRDERGQPGSVLSRWSVQAFTLPTLSEIKPSGKGRFGR